MLRAPILSVMLILVLTGCARLANSQLNPANWFGGSQEVAVAASRPLVPADRAAPYYDLRQPIAQISDMAIEPTRSGAILRATGVAPAQGYHNAQLAEMGRAGGVLTYEFRVEAPTRPVAGVQAITVARALSAGDLAGITTIRVLGQSNGREARR